VEILEDEDERIRLGDRLEESPPGGERLAPAVCAWLASPAQQPRVTFDPPACTLSGITPSTAARSFASAACASSLSSTPACDFVTSPSAQYATPSP
jgi:hypothetical protein